MSCGFARDGRKWGCFDALETRLTWTKLMMITISNLHFLHSQTYLVSMETIDRYLNVTLTENHDEASMLAMLTLASQTRTAIMGTVH